MGMSSKYFGSSLQIPLKTFHSGFQPLPDLPLHSNNRQSKELSSELEPALSRGAVNCGESGMP